MNREVRLIKGSDMIEKDFLRIKVINYFFYGEPSIFPTVAAEIPNVENPDNLYIILGKDWYIAYEEDETSVKIKMWVKREKTSDSYSQSLEMLEAFKNLFINNSEKLFYASLIYDTSYPFYLRLKERGYIEEVTHTLSGEKLKKLLFNRKMPNDLAPNSKLNFEMNHDVCFKMSDKFKERYSREQDDFSR